MLYNYSASEKGGEKMAEKSKNPHERHRERIRETFRKTGIENMPEHSVLELLLFYSVPRKDTNELAHRLIDTFGSLSRVLDAPYERLMEVDGIGDSSALLLSSIPALCRRYIEDSAGKKLSLAEPEDVMKYAVAKFYGCKSEVFYLICLDAAGNLINCCKLGEGTSADVLIDRRAVLETAFRNNADTVIFAHNHPDGVAAPSKNDLDMTSDFAKLLGGVGIRLADHIIVAGCDSISLASIPKFSLLFM